MKYFPIFLTFMLLGCSDASTELNNNGTNNDPNNTTEPTSGYINVAVSGLRGNLLLRDQTNETLDINTNGQSQFSTPVNTGTSYDIAIIDTPFYQDCAFTSPQTGSVAESEIVVVSIDCADKTVFSLTDNSAYDPQVSISDDGTAAVVWQQILGRSSSDIRIAQRINNVWLSPRILSASIGDPGSALGSPKVKIIGDQSYVVWNQPDQSTSCNNSGCRRIFHAIGNSTQWTLPSNDSAPHSLAGQNATKQQFAVNTVGDMVIVWTQNDGNVNRIFKSVKQSGIWTKPAGVDDAISDATENAVDPAVAINDQGDIVITWRQYAQESQGKIYMQEYRNGAWSTPAILSPNANSGNAYDPKIGLAANGNSLIVWRELTANNATTVHYAHYLNRNWAVDTNHDQIIADGDLPAIAMNASGEALVGYVSNGQLWFRKYNNGNLLTPEQVTVTGSKLFIDSFRPVQIAFNNQGQGFTTWQQAINPTCDNFTTICLYQVKKAKFTTTAFSDAMDVSAPTGGSDYPVSAMSNTGETLSAWLQQSGVRTVNIEEDQL